MLAKIQIYKMTQHPESLLGFSWRCAGCKSGVRGLGDTINAAAGIFCPN